jgi:molecular chaperone GrpE
VSLPVDETGETQRRRAQLAEDRLEEVLNAYRTLKRENDGHRERVTRNIERRYESRRERLLLRFIDILDNLDRALEAAETSFASSALVEGLILVRTQLLNTLKEEGLERVPALGLPYDPHHSEAVETRATPDPEQHQLVLKELLRGYRLGDRIARAARVVVGMYTPEAAEPAAEPPRAAPAAEPPAPVPPESSTQDLSLDEIIAHAEALDRATPPEAFDPLGPEDADEDEDLGEDLLGYLGDEARTAKEREDERG